MVIKVKAPRVISVISAVFFTTGLILATVIYPVFIILSAVAAFLPDLLRAVGALRDADELHEASSNVAARIALTVGTLYSAALFVLSDLGRIPLEQQREAWLTAFILIVTVRYIAYAIMYWDIRAAAPRICMVFGLFWASFSLLSCWGDWISLLMQAGLTAAPFFLLMLLVRRHPRTTGALALCAAVAAFLFFNQYRLFWGKLESLIVFILITLPLLSLGIGLLIKREEDLDENAE